MNRNILISFLLVWAAIMTYFSIRNINVADILRERFAQPSNLVDLERDYVFIKEFIETYYKIDGRNPMQRHNLDYIREHLSDEIEDKILYEYKQIIDYFLSAKAVQTFHIQKIVRNNKTGIYTSYIHLNLMSDSTKSLVQLDTKLSYSTVGTSGKKKIEIDFLEDRALSVPPLNLLDKTIYVGQMSLIKMPCLVDSLSSLSSKEKAIDVQISSTNSRQIKLSSKGKKTSSLSGESNFIVICKKQRFKIPLSNNNKNDLSTVYHHVKPSDAQKKRKLSAREKLKRDIEKQLGIVVETME